MARKLIAVAPDGSEVVSRTDREYTHFVIAPEHKWDREKREAVATGKWARVSAHNGYARALKSLQALQNNGNRDCLIARCFDPDTEDGAGRLEVERRSAQRAKDAQPEAKAEPQRSPFKLASVTTVDEGIGVAHIATVGNQAMVLEKHPLGQGEYIVLAWAPRSHHQWITWRVTPQGAFHGSYHADLAEAVADYRERCGQF